MNKALLTVVLGLGVSFYAVHALAAEAAVHENAHESAKAMVQETLNHKDQADDYGAPENVAEEAQKALDEMAKETAVETDIGSHMTPHVLHWDYTGARAAYAWGDIDPGFKTCKDGKAQSPVNISQYAAQPDLPALTTAYQPSPLVVANNGHTILVNVIPGSTMSIGDQAYELQQLRFHTPSEHYINGAPYPMEMQLLHQSQDGKTAVMAVMIEVGEANPVIQAIWEQAPVEPHTANANEDFPFTAASLLPGSMEYFSYTGSLTTPPCTEGVNWYVLKQPVRVSQEQLVAFQRLFPVNARYLQPLNNRVVTGK